VLPVPRQETDAAPDITDVIITITTIEGRVLRLVRDGAREIPLADLHDEVARVSHELGQCYRRLSDLTDRRDFGFATQRKLLRLQEQCLWLYRKSRKEQLFFQKLSLETRLRAVISPDAFALYQQLVNAEDDERRLAAKDDAVLAVCLLAEAETP
jgi:hypothetical protein